MKGHFETEVHLGVWDYELICFLDTPIAAKEVDRDLQIRFLRISYRPLAWLDQKIIGARIRTDIDW